MNTSITVPLIENNGSEGIATDVQHFLQAIAEMQREAEKRRRLVSELQQKEVGLRKEGEKCRALHDAIVARLSQSKADALRLQVEYQDVCRKEREVMAEIMGHRQTRMRLEALLKLEMLPSPAICEGAANCVHASVGNAEQLVSALCSWGLAGRCREYLRELYVAVAELCLTVHGEAGVRKCAAVCSTLLPLSELERVVLSLLPLLFTEAT